QRGRAGCAGAALEEDPVCGVESVQVELFVSGGAEEPEEVLEDLGHQVPGRAGVEPEAADRVRSCSPPDDVLLFEEIDIVAVRREQSRSGQAGNATADDRGPHRATSACVRIRAFTRSGTRTRCWAIRA